MDRDVKARLDQLAYLISKVQSTAGTSSVTLPIAESDVTNLVTDLATLTAATSQNGCLVRLTADQVNAGSPANITWSAADYNDGTIWSGGDPTKLTIKKTGRHFITGMATIDDGGAAGAVSVKVNATTFYYGNQLVKGASAFGDTFPYIPIVCGPIALSATDYFQIVTNGMTGAGAHTVKGHATTPYTWVSVMRVL